MGADNWRQCPQCENRKAFREIKMRQALSECYGKVTETEYEERKRQLSDFVMKPLDETLREDYEFHLDDVGGKLEIHYRCSCDYADCDFSFQFNRSEAIPDLQVKDDE